MLLSDGQITTSLVIAIIVGILALRLGRSLYLR